MSGDDVFAEIEADIAEEERLKAEQEARLNAERWDYKVDTEASANLGESFIDGILNKDNKNEPSFDTVDIDPVIAKSLLMANEAAITRYKEQNKDDNFTNHSRTRQAKKSIKTITTYQKAIENGEWVLNGIPIAFARGYFILDGIARLEAVIRSRKAIKTLVIVNLPASSELGVDRQQKRTFADVLRSRDHLPNATAVVAALLKLIRLDEHIKFWTNGRTGKDPLQPKHGVSTLPWATLERYYETNRDLLKNAAAFAMSREFQDADFGDAARVPLAYIAMRMGQDAALQTLFADYFRYRKASGDAPSADGTPGYALFDRIRTLLRDLRQAGSNLRPNPMIVWAFGSMALSDQIRDGKRSQSAYSWDAGAERFPIPAEYPGMLPPILTTGREIAGATVFDGEASSSKLTVIYDDIDPDTARRWLRENNYNNRKVQKPHCAGIKRDILAGDWVLTPHPICFGASGRLLNGQHRLQGLIDAAEVNPNVKLPTFIVRGITDESKAFATYDMQARRRPTLNDGTKDLIDLTLAIANIYYRRVILPAKAGASQEKTTEAALRSVVKERAALFKTATAFARRAGKLGTAAPLGYAAARIIEIARERSISDDAVNMFLDRAATGNNLPPSELSRARVKLTEDRLKGAEAREHRLSAAFSLMQAFEIDILGCKRGHHVFPEIALFEARQSRRDAALGVAPSAQLDLLPEGQTPVKRGRGRPRKIVQ